ncbi:probable RNA polymerase II nuclear localization protein SLC7A6OS [Sphaerodactylus townsendi]|uniref:Uncharacterized protein n=1 Tax=Sphaerodactylus townsendi TaxID=933632 RepID=A0ACB8EA41_9SAUR|nr:probable RNA polymerase II nuclear localization protein SLC7A6OS [Sphaerodactylus townsendi]
MEGAAVVRVKRKRGGSAPAEALLLACKRQRTESEDAGASAGGDGVEKNLFKLVATVDSQNEPVQKYIQEAITKNKAAQRLRPSLGSAQRIVQDLRSSKQARRQESRYRLIASHRPDLTDDRSALSADQSNENKQVAAEAKKNPSHEESYGFSGCSGEFQLLDIVQEEDVEKDPGIPQKTDDPDVILCNAVEMIRERLTVSDSTKEAACSMKEEEYVYDIYYMEAASSGWIENILSVQPYQDDYELVDEEVIPEEVYDDDDDENSENNWRNDYPDEDEFAEEDENSDRETSGSSDEDSGYIRTVWL